MALKKKPGGKRPFKRNFGPKHRRNDRIRVPEVRAIGPDGKQIGVVKTRDAIALAKKYGLDLVEISASARPPVCRILDYGKFMYEESKKNKQNKTVTTKLKEVKFRLNIDEHDYVTKVRRGEKFLMKGNKLKLTLMFRGREMEHKNLGFEVIKRARIDLEGVGQADSEARLVGRNITMTMSPLPEHKRKPKFVIEDDHDDDDDDHDDVEDDDIEESEE